MSGDSASDVAIDVIACPLKDGKNKLSPRRNASPRRNTSPRRNAKKNKTSPRRNSTSTTRRNTSTSPRRNASLRRNTSPRRNRKTTRLTENEKQKMIRNEIEKDLGFNQPFVVDDSLDDFIGERQRVSNILTSEGWDNRYSEKNLDRVRNVIYKDDVREEQELFDVKDDLIVLNPDSVELKTVEVPAEKVLEPPRRTLLQTLSSQRTQTNVAQSRLSLPRITDVPIGSNSIMRTIDLSNVGPTSPLRYVNNVTSTYRISKSNMRKYERNLEDYFRRSSRFNRKTSYDSHNMKRVGRLSTEEIINTEEQNDY